MGRTRLYSGGTILTMDERQSVEALLTVGGKIYAAGSRAELRAFAPEAAETDLEGHTLLPGFIDAHSHFSQVAAACLEVSFSGVTDQRELSRRVREFDRTERQWVTAAGFNGVGELSPEWVEGLLPGVPLLIKDASGHTGWFNRAARDALGLSPQTPDPSGGHFGRAFGVLNGYAEEKAYFDALSRVPLPGTAAFLNAYQKAQEIYASYGITTVQEGVINERMLPLLTALCESETLSLDLIGYVEPEALQAARTAFPGGFSGYRRHFHIAGIKTFLDGSPQAGTAWMRPPFDQKPYGGGAILTDNEVLSFLQLAVREQLQPLCHANGDAACAQFIRCVRQCEQTMPQLKRRRPVLIHGQLLGRDQIPELRELGVWASFFVAHIRHWGDSHIRRFGFDRAAMISPAGSALAEGVPFTFHQDAPVISPDMLETLRCATERKTAAGVLLGARERIPVREALRAVTVNAAAQYGEKRRKGTLAAGKVADFVILDCNPLLVSPAELSAITVCQTIKEDRTVFRRP